jgi:hypothetical protein
MKQKKMSFRFCNNNQILQHGRSWLSSLRFERAFLIDGMAFHWEGEGNPFFEWKDDIQHRHDMWPYEVKQNGVLTRIHELYGNFMTIMSLSITNRHCTGGQCMKALGVLATCGLELIANASAASTGQQRVFDDKKSSQWLRSLFLLVWCFGTGAIRRFRHVVWDAPIDSKEDNSYFFQIGLRGVYGHKINLVGPWGQLLQELDPRGCKLQVQDLFSAQIQMSFTGCSSHIRVDNFVNQFWSMVASFLDCCRCYTGGHCEKIQLGSIANAEYDVIKVTTGNGEKDDGLRHALCSAIVSACFPLHSRFNPYEYPGTVELTCTTNGAGNVKIPTPCGVQPEDQTAERLSQLPITKIKAATTIQSWYCRQCEHYAQYRISVTDSQRRGRYTRRGRCGSLGVRQNMQDGSDVAQDGDCGDGGSGDAYGSDSDTETNEKTIELAAEAAAAVLDKMGTGGAGSLSLAQFVGE